MHASKQRQTAVLATAHATAHATARASYFAVGLRTTPWLRELTTEQRR